MNQALALIGSTRATLAGFAVLAAGLIIAQGATASPWLIVVPLVLLALNLASAIATNRRLRRGGLGLFHIALLALMIVAAVGRLTHFDGQVEITEGAGFDPTTVEVQSEGPLHARRFDRDAFVQGPISVDYAPGVRRAQTRSEVAVAGADATFETRRVGDVVPLVIRGYRFYTTHNKGFAPILTWLPDDGVPLTGSLHLPSYPLFEWKQENRWTAPGGSEFRVFLQLEQPLAEGTAWTLDPGIATAVLVVHADGERSELRPGDSVRRAGGVLRYERLAGWMGYRIFFDPTLPWLLVLSVTAVAGLAWHLGRRPGAERAWHRLSDTHGEKAG